jgi:hypothetical protein
MMLAAELSTVGWIAPGLLAAEWRRHTRSVNAHPVPHDLVVFAEPPKYRFMEVLPDAGLHPFV